MHTCWDGRGNTPSRQTPPPPSDGGKSWVPAGADGPRTGGPPTFSTPWGLIVTWTRVIDSAPELPVKYIKPYSKTVLNAERRRPCLEVDSALFSMFLLSILGVHQPNFRFIITHWPVVCAYSYHAQSVAVLVLLISKTITECVLPPSRGTIFKFAWHAPALGLLPRSQSLDAPLFQVSQTYQQHSAMSFQLPAASNRPASVTARSSVAPEAMAAICALLVAVEEQQLSDTSQWFTWATKMNVYNE